MTCFCLIFLKTFYELYYDTRVFLFLILFHNYNVHFVDDESVSMKNV